MENEIQFLGGQLPPQQINVLTAAASAQAGHAVHSSTSVTGHSLSHILTHYSVWMEFRQATGSPKGYLYKWLIFSLCKINEGQTKTKSICQEEA